MAKSPIIQTQGLSKHFGFIRAVDSLNLEINGNETFVLLGSNGAGKTTTIRLLNGILQPTAGQAYLNGINVVESPLEVKRITGYLPETPGMYGKLTAYEFLEFSGGLYKVPRGVLMPRIEELLELFGLTGRMDDLLETFSTGMRKKVLLASTLIHDPPLLFFDEPTGGLDPVAARMVKDLVQVLTEKAEKTIVICTHNLDLAEDLASIIGILHEGRLLALGTYDQILGDTGTSDLEAAFIQITGGHIVSEELLDWREVKAEAPQKKKRRWRRG